MGTVSMQFRLRASSLVEVTVAATILVLVFGLALAVYARLVRQGPSPLRQRARLLAAEQIERTIRVRQWGNYVKQTGNLLVEQQVTNYPALPRLHRVQVRVSTGDSVLIEQQELTYTP